MKTFGSSFFVLCWGLLLLSGCGPPQPEVSATDSEVLHPLSMALASVLGSDLPLPGRVAVLGEGARDEYGVADDLNQALRKLDPQWQVRQVRGQDETILGNPSDWVALVTLNSETHAWRGTGIPMYSVVDAFNLADHLDEVFVAQALMETDGNSEAAVQWLDRQADVQRTQLNEAREALLAFQSERSMQTLLQRIEADATSLTDLNRKFQEIGVEVLRTETRLEALAENPDADSQALERELETLKGQRDTVGEELETLKQRVRAQHLEMAENEQELRKLERNMSEAQTALQTMMKRVQEARQSTEVPSTSPLKVLEMEAPPTEPSGRRLKPGVVALVVRSPAENTSESSQYRIIRAAELLSQAE